MVFCPDDGPGVQYEAYAPFAHVPGRYEWCRLCTPSHGVFDAFIVLGPTTADPAHVVVNSDLGKEFMTDRFPECTTVRVPPGDLRITTSGDGRTVVGMCRSPSGPVRHAEMELAATPGASPRAVPYGGEGRPVWGSRWTCWGVDLVLEAAVRGHVVDAASKRTEVTGMPGVVTLGSFGRLEPLG